MDWNALAQILMQQGADPRVVQALFHQNKVQASPIPEAPVPPQATPAPDVEPQAPQMSPIPQVTPPMPTPNPMRMQQQREADPTQGYMPAGGFGATGPMTGTELERRIQAPPSSNPFEGRGTDYSKGTWPWQQEFWSQLSGQVGQMGLQAMRGADGQIHQPSQLDQTITQVAPMLMGAGRLVAPIKMGAKAIAERAGRERLSDTVETIMRKAWGRGAGTPRPTPTPRQPSSLAEELQAIHRSVKRQPNSQPLNLRNDNRFLRGNALDKRKAYYKNVSKVRRQNQTLINQLERKGQLDYRTKGLVE